VLCPAPNFEAGSVADLLPLLMTQKSVKKLAPLVNYHVELENADEIRIVDPPNETWDSFQATWAQ
jgi:hypothetical protein